MTEPPIRQLLAVTAGLLGWRSSGTGFLTLPHVSIARGHWSDSSQAPASSGRPGCPSFR